MANTLLDFVMSLVRDPGAAARYAADPAQAIADAHLTDVTSADVNNLIPVVSESLSGLDSLGAESAGNVWASGAATAAFDAFGDHVPVDAGHQVISHVIEQPIQHAQDVLDAPDALTGSTVPDEPFDDTSVQISEPVIEDVPIGEPMLGADWGPAVEGTFDDTHHTDGAAGFDIFD